MTESVKTIATDDWVDIATAKKSERVCTISRAQVPKLCFRMLQEKNSKKRKGLRTLRVVIGLDSKI